MLIAFSTTLETLAAPHTHRMHELIVCVSGTATLHASGRSYGINHRTTVLIPAGIPHQYEITGPNSALVTIICFESKSLEDRHGATTLPASYARLLNTATTSASLDEESAKENVELARIIMKTLGSDLPYSRDKAVALLNTILVNHLSWIDSPGMTTEHARSDEIQKVLRWIDKHFSEAITIESAAEKAHMSRSVFTRNFKKHTNMTFSKYVSSVRLKHSAKLLLRNCMPISDAAYQSGYRNLGHFYAQFQKQYGITPNQYRNVTEGHT